MLKFLAALAPLLLVGANGFTPGPVPQKRVEGAGAVKVFNDAGIAAGGSWGISLNFADAGVTPFDQVVANGFTLSDGGQPITSLGGAGNALVTCAGGSCGVYVDAGDPLSGSGYVSVNGSVVGFDAGGALVTSTTADLNLFVGIDGGSDSNACTDAGDPCLTIQGAIAKAPLVYANSVGVSVACGTYDAGVYVTGIGIAGATGLFNLSGALSNSTTLDGGSATGTVTSASHTAAHNPWDTMTVTGAGWTPGDLAGRYLVTTGGTGSGQTFLIDSNDAGTLTIISKWGTTPNGTTTYAIQEPCAVISGAVKGLPVLAAGVVARSSNRAAFIVAGNEAGVSISKFKITVASSWGVGVFQGGNVALDSIQCAGPTQVCVNSSSSTGTGGTGAGGQSFLTMTRMLSTTASTTLLHFVVGNYAPTIIQQSYTNGGLAAASIGANSKGTVLQDSFNGMRSLGVQIGDSSTWLVQDLHATCAANATDGGSLIAGSTGVDLIGADTAGGSAIGGVVAFLNNDSFSTCDVAVRSRGPGTAADLVANVGSASTTGFLVANGGYLRWNVASIITAPTEVILDLATDETTALHSFTRASVASGTCNSTPDYGSRACARP